MHWLAYAMRFGLFNELAWYIFFGAFEPTGSHSW